MGADRLKEAARVLRERAGAATPVDHTYPWRYTEATFGDPSSGPTHVAVTCCAATGVESRHFIHSDEGSGETAGIATFIATMHPGVALALADWLDHSATFAVHMVTTDHPASRVADMILGGTA